jgi:hypothetical protein
MKGFRCFTLKVGADGTASDRHKVGSTTSTWVSNYSMSNVFQFAFDPNGDGLYTTADWFRIDQLNPRLYSPAAT